MNPKIAILDSGVGGLSFVKEIQSKLPQAKLIYCYDDAFYPYGLLDETTLETRTLQLIKALLKKQHLDLIILACNTASTTCLPLLRRELAVPIVGVVPAIKPAASKSKTGVVAVLSTKATAQSSYTDKLIELYAPSIKVIKIASQKLVDLAEEKIAGHPVFLNPDWTELKTLKKEPKLDTVVLACTHFSHLKDELSLFLGPNIDLIDPILGVSTQVQKLLSTQSSSTQSMDTSLCVYFTKNPTKELKPHDLAWNDLFKIQEIHHLIVPD